jgi:hypothetical protein
MINKVTASYILSASLATALGACTAPPGEATSNPAAVTSDHAVPATTNPAWPGYSWRLPKTIVTATVTYTLTGCAMTAGGRVQPITDIQVDFKAAGVPDTYLGPELPDGWVSRSAKDLSSFWSNTSLSLETDPSTRILTHLMSSPINQATTIIGNAITGATKIAAASLGVPSAAGAIQAVAPCLNVKTVTERIKQNQQALSALAGQTTQAAVTKQAQLTMAINNDTKKLTISFSCRIDPGIISNFATPGNHCPVTPEIVPGKDPSDPNHPIPADGRIAVLGLIPKDLAGVPWITGYNPAVPNVELSTQQIGIYLDFGNAHPSILSQCAAGTGGCFYHRVNAGKETIFREPAYLNVTPWIIAGTGSAVVKDTSQKHVAEPVLLPFAQFGVPRTVAVVAGFGQSPNWDIAMNTMGEMGATKAGTVATGLGLSSLFSSAAGGASAILTEVRSSETAVDPSLQGQVATAQALYNLANAKQQLLALCAKTYMPDVCPKP